MPQFTIEMTYDLPVYVHRTVEADNLETAIAFAMENEDWADEKKDYDSAGPTRVTGAWAGSVAYEADQLPVPVDDAANATSLMAEAIKLVMRCARGELERPVTERQPWPEAEAALKRAVAAAGLEV